MQKIRSIFEPMVFGVCEYLGEKMHIPSYRIRLFFIYTSFLTFGSPVFIYLGMAFILNIRAYMNRCKRSSIWDL